MENVRDALERAEVLDLDAEDARTVAVVGGGALALFGLSRFNLVGGLLALVGGALVYAGLRGRDMRTAGRGMARTGRRVMRGGARVDAHQTFTVNRSPEEVYRAWRELENLPRFMKHIDRVERLEGGCTRWTARLVENAPAVSWEAETTEDVPNRRIAWRSLPGSTIVNDGEVRFEPIRDGRACEIHLVMHYKLAGGLVGSAVTRVLDPAIGAEIREDLRRFKMMLEAGELATTIGQPSGRDAGDRREIDQRLGGE